jgi:hypothetical protein
MKSAFGLTGYTGPWKPYSIRLCNISLPMEPFVREVPTTAMDLGENRQSSLLLFLPFVRQRLLELDFDFFLADFLLFFGVTKLINTPKFEIEFI